VAHVVPVEHLEDPRLADYSHRTDVALRKAEGAGHGIYLAESALVLERALRAGHAPRSVLALGGTVDEALALVGDRDVPVFTGPGELLAELTGYVLHRGVVASLDRPPLPSVASLLADVVDPTNVGAIFRSVGAIGADAVLVTPRCTDPFYRRAIRVSMGTVLQVPWTRTGEWLETRAALADAGFHVAALALTPDAVSLRDIPAEEHERLAIVLGSEGPGLSEEAIRSADTVVRIPMAHGIDSLNVAAASAVALYALTAPTG
jgi:tRNA G18 (ribose-2'-O)-methylase SpoU